MQYIDGGVCAPKGYKAAGVNCGIRKSKKKDLALIVSEKLAATAGVYTKNLVKGAPITVTKEHIANGYAQAIICNSGNANTIANNVGSNLPINLHRSGTPEGTITAVVGSTCVDTATGAIYRKTSGTGNTGWVTP